MSYKNQEDPARLYCFERCSACGRCREKGCMTKCNGCSGRDDPTRTKHDPYDIDDRCRCSEGILQARLQSGQLIQYRYQNNPFGGGTKPRDLTEDERAWQEYVRQQRERMNDPNFNPVEITGGDGAAGAT